MARVGRPRTLSCDNPYCPPELLELSHEWHYNMPITHYECLRCGWTASYDPILRHFIRTTSTRDGIDPDGYEGISVDELNTIVEEYESQINEADEIDDSTGKYRNRNTKNARRNDRYKRLGK